MLEKYFKVIIYHDNEEVVTEEYDGSDAEELLDNVYSFFDGNHRYGEFCVGRTKYEASRAMMEFFDANIEKAQEAISLNYGLREKLENII